MPAAETDLGADDEVDLLSPSQTTVEHGIDEDGRTPLREEKVGDELREPLPSTVSALPVLTDLVLEQTWAADLVAASDTLFRCDVRVLQDGAGGMIVIGNVAMWALAENAAIGNAPVEFLTGRSAERVRRVTGAAPESGPGAFATFLRNQVFTMNPPLHARVRRLVTRDLMPRAVLGMAEHAEQVIAEVVAEVSRSTGTVDLSGDVAAPYVTRFWTGQLGMPAESAARVQQLMHEMNRMFLFSPTPEDRAMMLAATDEYMELVGATVARAWERGDNALLGRLAQGLEGIEAPERPSDLGALVAANFFDGFHTVGVALANAVWCLFSDPAGVERVRQEPALVPAAFTEGTRLAAPLMLTTRVALSDVEYEGLHIPEGMPVTMVWSAGNRDPEAYDEPAAYRLDREPRVGMTFGGGAHICPGRNAARMLSEVALRTLTAPGVELHLGPVDGSDPGWVPCSGIRRRRAIPVQVRQAAAA